MLVLYSVILMKMDESMSHDMHTMSVATPPMADYPPPYAGRNHHLDRDSVPFFCYHDSCSLQSSLLLVDFVIQSRAMLDHVGHVFSRFGSIPKITGLRAFQYAAQIHGYSKRVYPDARVNVLIGSIRRFV